MSCEPSLSLRTTAKAALVAAVFGGGTLGLLGCTTSYVPYVPIVEDWQGDFHLEEDPSLLTNDHVDRVQIVLKEYHRPFKVRNGVLYITKQLRDDEELLWNLTTKAEGLKNGTWVPPSQQVISPTARVAHTVPDSALPRAVRGADERIEIETDCLRAEVWPRGYVSGVKANTLLDKKTGARDGSFGLDIVDFLMGPGAEGGLPYQFNNKVHGRIAKHYVELPQICTQAKQIESEFVIVREGDAENRFRIVPQGRWPAPRTYRVLAHGRGEAVINGKTVTIDGEFAFEVPDQ